MGQITKTYVSVSTAADKLDLSTCQVMDLIQAGDLGGAEFEGHVLISEKSVEKRALRAQYLATVGPSLALSV